MIFNSFQFIVFFIAVTIAYYIVPHKFRWILLLIGSYIFYMAWNPILIVLLLFSTFVNYAAAIMMSATLFDKHRNKIFIAALLINFGLLFIFKYLVFINNSAIMLAGLLNVNYTFTELYIVLPMGISFYTFQVAGYLIDVYRKDVKVERNFFVLSLFITFFPQLVAGPIERTDSLLPQLLTQKRFSLDNLIEGGKYCISGFFKKIVIADRTAIIVDNIYNNTSSFSGLYFIIATMLFAFQIYCDFCGYSEIAKGTAKILGIDLMNNFDRPYFAKSIREFWRRWHISLSTWFKDYLYIPLGGSRVTTKRFYFNTFVTFLVSGIWHGANWTFVIWGVIHGAYQIVGHRTHNLRKNIRTPKIVSLCITFILVCFAWIFFRANNVSDAFYVISNLFSDIRSWTSLGYLYGVANNLGVSLFEVVLIGMSIVILLATEAMSRRSPLPTRLGKISVWAEGSYYYILSLIIFMFGVFNNASQFIYFQF